MLGNHTIETKKAPKAARGAERAPVTARARFREPGLNPFDVELFDLSSTGLNPLEAIVRRADGNNYGCEFVHPLHVSVAQHLQAKLRGE